MCSVIPTRGVYFCQGPFIKDCLDFDVVIVDPETYVTLYDGAIKDRVLTVVLYTTIGIALSILVFSCKLFYHVMLSGMDNRNYRKRQLMRYLHNIEHSWKHEKLELPVEREEEDSMINDLTIEEPVDGNSISTSNSTTNITMRSEIDESQLDNEGTLKSEESLSTAETWLEWVVSVFWKALGYYIVCHNKHDSIT